MKDTDLFLLECVHAGHCKDPMLMFVRAGMFSLSWHVRLQRPY